MNDRQLLVDAIDGLSLPTRTRVLIATSGGSDSVALALAFHQVSLRPGREWQVCLGHVNHRLRGTDSDLDEAFVLELGRRLDVGVETVRVDTKAYAAEHGLSMETAARDLRYRELHRMVRAWGGDFIAVGHHADDQAETVLMNLLRGAGLDGLAGMSNRSGAIVRPFLALSRENINAALAEWGEGHRVDHSNEDVTPRRNFLRHRVMAVLKEIRPDVGLAVAHTANSISADADFLSLETRRACLQMDVRLDGHHVWASTGVFRTLHPALQSRAIRVLVEALCGDTRDLSQEHVRRMRDAIASPERTRNLRSQLPRLLQLEVGRDRFHLYREPLEIPAITDSIEVPVPGSAHTIFGSLEVTIKEQESEGEVLFERVVCGPYQAFCDASVVGDRLTMRSRRPGDYVHLERARGGKKVQDLFVDAKIPRAERDRVPIVATSDSIVWIPGFGVDRRAAVGPKSVHVAHLRFQPFS